MDYENYYFGMNIIWWGLGIILLFLIFLIFLIPFESINQKLKKQSANNLLQKRFVVGDITELEYNDEKKNLKEKFYIS
jgi:putative membrane protein